MSAQMIACEMNECARMIGKLRVLHDLNLMNEIVF